MTTRLVDLKLTREQAGLWVIVLVLFGMTVYVTWRYIGTFVLGLFLYYVTRPIHARIEGRIPSRTVSVTLALVAVAIPVLVLVVWTIAVAFRVLRDLFGDETVNQQIPTIPDLSGVFTAFDTAVRAFLTDPVGMLSGGLGQGVVVLLGTVEASVAVVVNVGLHLFIVLILVFFLLRDDYRIVAWARSTVVGEGSVLETFLRAVDRDLTNVYFGNILNAVLTGALGALTYTLLNLIAPETVRIPEPALFGLLTGVASLIPVIGIKLVWVPLGILLTVDAALTDRSALWFPLVFAAVSVVVVDTLPDQFLRPYISGRSLHVGAVMLAYTFGPLMFGWYGVFLGPLLLVVIVEGARYLVPALVGKQAEALSSPEDGADSGVSKSLDADDVLPDADSDAAEADGTSHPD